MIDVTEGYANVNGIRLHYAESGSGDSLVLMLHGFPDYWYTWRYQLPALGEKYHVVAPDMRGFNLSDKPERVEDYRIQVLVEDIVGLIKHFGAESAAIVAHDWGAAVAWALALKYPERVSKLAVLQVPPPAVWRANMSLHQLMRSWYMLLFLLPRIPEWIIRRKRFAALDKMFTAGVERKGSFDGDDIEHLKTALRQPGALTASLNYYRANVRTMATKKGSSKKAGDGESATAQATDECIRVPTLFIFGEKDFAILPSTVKGIAAFVDAPYTELRIANSSHWVQIEAKDEVNAALLKFLGAT